MVEWLINCNMCTQKNKESSLNNERAFFAAHIVIGIRHAQKYVMNE